MNPVVGLDVSKGESHAQAFLDREIPHGKIFKFKHDLEGLASFLNYVRDEWSTAAGCALPLLWKQQAIIIVQILDEHQYMYIVINPLISYESKKTNLRRVKTDAADAYQLGVLFYKEEFEPTPA